MLSRKLSTIMKGYAILFIGYHNLLHYGTFNFIKENENTFDINRTFAFFDQIKDFNWSVICDIFSFIGWIGVPVFLFISGYGLTKKYERDVKLEVRKYVSYSFKKLFLLMLPGVLFFILLALVEGNLLSAGKRLLSLTMMANFLYPFSTITPGVYWYFGLTFELYILYIFCKHLNTNKLYLLLGGGLALQVITYSLVGNGGVWSFVRHNFTGWVHVFILGMIVARKEDSWNVLNLNIPVLLLACVLCFVLLPISELSSITWLLFTPFLALVFFFFLAVLASKNVLLRTIGLWLGEYSAFIFVFHPIARACILKLNVDLRLTLVLYTVLCFLGAICYKYLYNKLMTLCIFKSSPNKLSI